MHKLLLPLAALLALAAPSVIAIEPQGGPPSPWILQGSATVNGCDAPAVATIYTWVQAWSANFQLSLVGGCEDLVTVFYGTGDIDWGFDLSDFVAQVPSSGRVGGFFDGPTVPLDLYQTLPDGRAVHIEGDFVIIF